MADSGHCLLPCPEQIAAIKETRVRRCPSASTEALWCKRSPRRQRRVRRRGRELKRALPSAGHKPDSTTTGDPRPVRSSSRPWTFPDQSAALEPRPADGAFMGSRRARTHLSSQAGTTGGNQRQPGDTQVGGRRPARLHGLSRVPSCSRRMEGTLREHGHRGLHASGRRHLRRVVSSCRCRHSRDARVERNAFTFVMRGSFSSRLYSDDSTATSATLPSASL